MMLNLRSMWRKSDEINHGSKPIQPDAPISKTLANPQLETLNGKLLP